MAVRRSRDAASSRQTPWSVCAPTDPTTLLPLRAALLREKVLPPMLSVCGCDLGMEDTTVLIGRLDDDHTLLSDEAAAAIRYAVAADSPVDTLDYDVRDAIKHVLDDEPLPPGLIALRAALDNGCC